MDEPSVELLERCRVGDESAATELFRRYVGRLTILARARMSSRIAGRFDPEDVVLSAYRSFFVRARTGRFSLERSGDLWRLLVGIVLKKLSHQIARHTADRRSVDREQRLVPDSDSAFSVGETTPSSPTAEQAVEMADVMEVFMNRLDPRSRRIFELRLQDQKIDEIAAAMAVHERTIRRILDELEMRLRAMLLESPDDASRSVAAGRAPFSGKSLDQLLQCLLGSAPAVALSRDRPDVPAEFETLLRRCLAPVPTDRYTTIAELGRALHSFVPPKLD